MRIAWYKPKPVSFRFPISSFLSFSLFLFFLLCLVPPLNVARFHLFSFPRFHSSTFISLSVRFFHLFPREPCPPPLPPCTPIPFPFVREPF